MAPSQHRVLTLLGLVASVRAINCPACYTQSVAGVIHCPLIPAPEEPCYEPACVKVMTTTIPGKNPACSATPTVTTYAACPTTATCRKGCRTVTKTVTGTSMSCGVRWETDPPANTGSVSWATGPYENTGGVSWATGLYENTGGVSWATDAESTGGVSWATDIPEVTASVTWNKRQDEEQPEPTEEPEPVEDPVDNMPFPFPIPTPTNVIGLRPPTYSIIWGKRQDEEQPEPTEEPEPIEDPGDDLPFHFPIPTPTNVIELKPPTYSVIWGKRQDEEPQATETPEVPETPEEPAEEPPTPPSGPPSFPSFLIPSPPKQSDYFGIGKPKMSISWYKRQDGEEPEPTEEPIDGPTDIPAPPQITPPNSLGIQPPTFSISWGKREADAEVNTGYPIPSQYLSWLSKYPQPPKETEGPTYVTWGKEKREADAQVNTIGLGEPSQGISWYKQHPHPKPTSADGPGYISWDKREADAQVDTIGMGEPSQWISWYKQHPHPKPTSADGPGYISWGKREPQVTPPNSIGLQPPQQTISFDTSSASSEAYISWGKREAAPEPTAAAVLNKRAEVKTGCGLTTTVSRVTPCPLIRCPAIACALPLEAAAEAYDVVQRRTEPSEHANPEPPCPVTVTAIKKCPTCPSCGPIGVPTPLSMPTKTYTKPAPVSGTIPACKTTTTLIVPPCVPPMCPDYSTACDPYIPIPTWETMKRDVIEKTIITVKTSYGLTPIPVSTPAPSTCSGTKTLTAIASCPTYTCVPYCDPYQVVR